MADHERSREDGRPDVPLNTVGAAEFVRSISGGRCSPNWLVKLRSVGGGPPFQYFGRTPVYRVTDLADWVAGRKSDAAFASTAEARAAGACRAPARPGRGRPRKSVRPDLPVHIPADS